MTQVLKKFEQCSLDNYITETQEQKEMIEYFKNCLANGFKDNIVITGSVGTGKTHLAYALINFMEEIKDYGNIRVYSQKNANITTIKSMIDNIRILWKSDSDSYDRNVVAEYSKIPLLIIDEVGVQYGSDSERIELFEIFNTRYGNELPTMIISNCNKEQMAKILGQRIIDRLFSGAKVFELTGKSRR